MQSWLRAFVPAPVAINARERLRIVLGALLGILFTAGISRILVQSPLLAGYGGAWLAAPLGASAVLVFVAPASPLAQPWAVVAGNSISALIGLLCAALIPEPVLAVAVAVAVAIGMMLALRCLHPPGGAMAVLAVLLHANHAEFAAVALINSLLLVAAGMVYNPLTRRPYPHAQLPAAKTAQAPVARFRKQDLDAVLARYNQVLDVSRDDLERLLQAAEVEGYRRSVGEIRCRDAMSPDVLCVAPDSTVQQAWILMRSRRVKALPVIDPRKKVMGIITMADFLRAAQVDSSQALGVRLRHFFLASREDRQAGAQALVGAIMTPAPTTIGQDRHLVELIPLFTDAGHHHIPIVDEEGSIVGIITESDFVRALYQGERTAPAAGSASVAAAETGR